MRIRVIEKSDGNHDWTIGMDEHELYDLFCSLTAWRLVHEMGEDEQVNLIKHKVVHMVHKVVDVLDEKDIAQMRDPILRLVTSERKRLKLTWDLIDRQKE